MAQWRSKATSPVNSSDNQFDILAEEAPEKTTAEVYRTKEQAIKTKDTDQHTHCFRVENMENTWHPMDMDKTSTEKELNCVEKSHTQAAVILHDRGNQLIKKSVTCNSLLENVQKKALLSNLSPTQIKQPQWETYEIPEKGDIEIEDSTVASTTSEIALPFKNTHQHKLSLDLTNTSPKTQTPSANGIPRSKPSFPSAKRNNASSTKHLQRTNATSSAKPDTFSVQPSIPQAEPTPSQQEPSYSPPDSSTTTTTSHADTPSVPNVSSHGGTEPPSPTIQTPAEWFSYNGGTSISEERTSEPILPPGFEQPFIFSAKPTQYPSPNPRPSPFSPPTTSFAHTSHTSESTNPSQSDGLHLPSIPHFPLFVLNTSHNPTHLPDNRTRA